MYSVEPHRTNAAMASCYGAFLDSVAEEEKVVKLSILPFHSKDVAQSEVTPLQPSPTSMCFFPEQEFSKQLLGSEDRCEAATYRDSTIFQRAIPERMLALTCTMLLEIPVLLLISGGSDKLCLLMGRRRYQLLVGFLPLTSAISGNVGLQASTLTTRAISHSHVTTGDFWRWVAAELGAAAYLGFGMGFLLSTMAYLTSNYDMAFAVSIMVAQVLSIVTAGLTGTLAPLLFSFVFRRDSGKWGGPLETAVQDIVGSFAMVVVSYHILKLLGPAPIDPFDTCGPRH